ncbi:MAG TPA: hypothetical protein VL354_14245 [Spirochaetia bacterium]|nr:hypothetical protein [Spirochaetia bacterium]
MSRIPVHTIESAPASVRPVLETLAQRSFVAPGHLMNLHAQMAHAPAVLSAYMGIRRAAEEQSVLDQKTRTAVMLTVDSLEGGAYTRTISPYLAKRAGWSAEETAQLLAGTSPSSHLHALLEVVRHAVKNKGDVDDATWRRALDAGWTEVELADTFTGIGLALFINYFVRYAGVAPDVTAGEKSA